MRPTDGLSEFTETALSLGRKVGLSAETIHRRRRAGQIEAVRVGHQWRFRPDAAFSLIEVSPAAPLTKDHEAEVNRVLAGA